MAGHEESDLSGKALLKRYEGLVTVRSKAVKGKGAWYWSHLVPLMVYHPESGLPKAVKLRCSLCNAVFSASNPSRTASEHLKRGTCPNFNGVVPKPLASQPGPHPSPTITPRKRTAVGLPPHSLISAGDVGTPLLLSGGKEDLGALALLEDSVKKLKTSPGGLRVCDNNYQGYPSKAQADAALNLLAEWLYESCGAVSFSCVEHPKFKSFLAQLGLPPVSRRYLAGANLDAKYAEVKHDSELKLREALFFQLASDGWKKKDAMGETLVNITLNLPSGNSLFRSVVNVNMSAVSVKLVEETLADALASVCGTSPERCVGIVADSDRYSLSALEELEYRFPRMVNLCCQAQGFSNLLKDFNKHLLLFRSITTECAKISAFFNNQPHARSFLHKYQHEEYHGVKLLRTPPDPQFGAEPHYAHALVMLDDISASARALQHAVRDASFNPQLCSDEQGREVADLVGSVRFWSDLEAVQELVKIVNTMVRDVEADRPLVSACLPLWDELRAHVKDWCARHDQGDASAGIHEVIEMRFGKNYHPAWAAALVLDPLYLLRDASGKYLPPFRCLTPEQEKDVDRLITRLVAREEAHLALMELMKWRAEGLDPLYAQAVQVKERDPVTGRMKPVNPQSRRLVWETCLSEYKSLGKVAVRLLFLHATSCGLKCNWSMWRWAYRSGNSRLAVEKAEKMIFIASHAKLERRDFTNEEEKDAELFMNGDDGDDNIPDEVFMNTSSL